MPEGIAVAEADETFARLPAGWHRMRSCGWPHPGVARCRMFVGGAPQREEGREPRSPAGQPWARAAARAKPGGEADRGTRAGAVRAALASALPALRAVHPGRDRSAQARGRSAGVARPRAAMRPGWNAEWRVHHSAAGCERALRGSHRFVPACRIIGDARSFRVFRSFRPLSSVLCRPRHRPNRARIGLETRRDVVRSPSTRKTQSAYKSVRDPSVRAH